MKRATGFLVLFFFVLSMILAGCAANEPTALQSGPTAVQSGAATAAAQAVAFNKAEVDLSVSSERLVFGESDNPNREYVRPGRKLSLQAKVEKREEDATAGGRVEFTIEGDVVDSVPFYMDEGEDSVIVKTNTILPVGPYLSLSEGEQTPLHFEARVLPDNLSEDINEANNTESMDKNVQGADFSGNDIIAATKIVSLKTDGDLGENIAQPGDSIAIRTEYRSVEGGGQTRLLLYVDGQMVMNNHSSLSKSSSNNNTFIYYVPWNASGSLTIRAQMEDGTNTTIEIPIAEFDFEIRSQGISWEYGSSTAAGKRLSIICRISKNSDISFRHAQALRVMFFVNGVASEPIDVWSELTQPPHMTEVYYAYTIPENCTWPLQVTAVVDPGGLYGEITTINNMASMVIPQTPEGGDAPDLSVSAENIWACPGEIVPGTEIQLFAAVYNASSEQVLSERVKFFIDGVQIDPSNELHSNVIGGGQYRIFQKKWRVPDDLSADPVFAVEVAPGSNGQDAEPSDNYAETTLEIARPDLSIENLSVMGTKGGDLYSMCPALACFTLRNAGAAPVSGAEIALALEGTLSETITVDIHAFGTTEVQIPFTLPQVADESPPAAEITALSGKVYPVLPTVTVHLTVTVDPDNEMAENSEDNNAAGEDLTVGAPPSQGVVYVHTEYIYGADIEGASVSITAGGKTASADTNSFGNCTFQNVPFGAYEVSAVRSGYNPVQSQEETLYEGNGYDYATIVMDDYSFVTGRVTGGGSGLEDVSIVLDGTALYTRTDVSGNYTLKVPAGPLLLKVRKLGYGMQDISMTMAKGETITRDIPMNPTNLANVYGKVSGTQGEPLAGMNVEAVGADGSVIISTTTDADGNYSMDVPTSAPEVWDIKIRASGQGLSATISTYLYQGLQTACYISFEPVDDSGAAGETLSSIRCRVTPWANCQKFPGIGSADDFEADAVYGMFGLDAFVMANDSVITDFDLTIEPDFWLQGGVESTFSPLDVFDLGPITGAALDVVGMVIPLEVPLAVTFHSEARTKVWIKKIVVESDGVEVGEAVYPDTVNQYGYAPNAAVNWNDCRIKIYLKVMPEHDVTNPLAGYHYDRVLVIWDPKEKSTEIQYYTARWDSNLGREVYTDQG